MLFHPTNDVAISIIDLDTLTLSHPVFDYGDLIRSVATGAEVKEHSWSRIIEVTRGFLNEIPIDMDQREPFAQAPAHMSLMLDIRF